MAWQRISVVPLRFVFMEEILGRSFVSVQQGVNSIADRWERAAEKYTCGKRMARVARRCPGEGFMGCNDPMESVQFSFGVEMQKERENPLS
jgi:hypothetical protein